jgi:GT2 family glycosyltransferase
VEKKISIIVSVYKDTESLDFILKSLENQTILPNEVIVSEDGDSEEMAEYILKANVRYSSLKIVHLFQEDIGWRKNKALNRAIIASKCDYLVFIDGDCIPYSTFIEGHLSIAKTGQVLCGKRFELGQSFSEKIRQGELQFSELERNFLRYLPSLIKDKARHPEDGVYLKPNSFIANMVHKRFVRHIIGCNFSCFKNDLLKINGFNEDFVLPSEGEDVDPSWRFRSVGIELYSCRNVANIFHLYHKKRFSEKEGEVNREIMYSNSKQNIFYCHNGIIKN